MMRAPPEDKGNRTSQYRDFTKGRQTVGFTFSKVHSQHDARVIYGIGAQDADAARLDHAPEPVGRRGIQSPAFTAQFNLIVRNQLCPKGHHFKRQRRLSAARWAEDQKPLALDGHATGVPSG